MLDRRIHHRRPLDIFFNKYIDGYPYLCRSSDLSSGGLRATSFTEPDCMAEGFALELQLPGQDESVWVWAHTVWKEGREQALRFVSLHAQDRERLDQYLTPSC